MPYFTWTGITIQGDSCRGNMYVHSEKQLHKELLQQDIAVLQSRVVLPWSAWRRPSAQQSIAFFEGLATLLDAGIHLDEALTLLKEKHAHAGFQKLIDDLQLSLHDGASLTQSLNPYIQFFGPCAIELISSGEHVGRLPSALRLAAQHQAQQAEFTKRVKSVVLLPVITFCFFVVIAFVILTYVVPVFASMFLSAQKELPWITRSLLELSEWCAHTSLTLLGLGIGASVYLGKKFMQKPYVKKYKDSWVLAIPLFGSLLRKKELFQFFQTSSLLLEGSMHEVPALQTSCAGLYNDYIRANVEKAVQQVQVGHSFADALAGIPLRVPRQVQAMLAVGQESGTFGVALAHGAHFYKQEVDRLLHVISALLQPFLMIILGVCITVLIFAVYLPVLQLSHVIM